MIGYVTIGTNDFERAKGFYSALLGEIGAKEIPVSERMAMYGAGPGPMIAVCTPFDEKSACVGNGTMVAIAVDSPEKVAKLHAKALELGGTDEGAPGPRGDGGLHFGYFRDLDGNKLAAAYLGG